MESAAHRLEKMSGLVPLPSVLKMIWPASDESPQWRRELTGGEDEPERAGDAGGVEALDIGVEAMDMREEERKRKNRDEDIRRRHRY